MEPRGKTLPANRVRTCRCCGSDSLEQVLSLGDLPIGDDFRQTSGEADAVCPQELLVCSGCGLPTLSHVVDPTVLYRDQSYLYRTAISPGLPEHFLAVARHLAGTCGLSASDLVVDIGCNDGTLLKAFQRLGRSRLHGFEPTPWLAVVASETGIPVTNEFFGRGTAFSGKAALVTANNVFANIDDLDGFLTGLDGMLAPDGTFVVETGYGVDLVQNAVLDNIYHEHLSYFTLRSLGALFSRHGLEIWNAERVHTKGGSLRCYAQRRGGSREIASSYQELATLESELGFDTLLPFLAFGHRLESLRTRVQDWIGAQRAPIAGFGASVGTVTVLEYFGLHRIVDVLYDDNSAKFGTFSPLRNIPVRSADRMVADAPGMVAVLPWRYRHRIQERHGSSLPKSGHFLSLLPSLALHGADRSTVALP